MARIGALGRGRRVRKMRRISGSFWTPERDERLRRLEAEGLSAAKIGEKLGTTRGAVLGRLHRLSGAALTYPSYIRQEKKARARAAATHERAQTCREHGDPQNAAGDYARSRS